MYERVKATMAPFISDKLQNDVFCSGLEEFFYHYFRHLAAKWDQWDGVAYIYGERGWFGRVYDYLRSKETVENRTLALKTYLPKWKGFLVNEPAEKMTATEAIVKLDRVVSCLFANIWVKDNHCSVPEKKKPPEFNVKAVSPS